MTSRHQADWIPYRWGGTPAGGRRVERCGRGGRPEGPGLLLGWSRCPSGRGGGCQRRSPVPRRRGRCARTVPGARRGGGGSRRGGAGGGAAPCLPAGGRSRTGKGGGGPFPSPNFGPVPLREVEWRVSGESCRSGGERERRAGSVAAELSCLPPPQGPPAGRAAADGVLRRRWRPSPLGRRGPPPGAGRALAAHRGGAAGPGAAAASPRRGSSRGRRCRHGEERDRHGSARRTAAIGSAVAISYGSRRRRPESPVRQRAAGGGGGGARSPARPGRAGVRAAAAVPSPFPGPERQRLPPADENSLFVSRRCEGGMRRRRGRAGRGATVKPRPNLCFGVTFVLRVFFFSVFIKTSFFQTELLQEEITGF